MSMGKMLEVSEAVINGIIPDVEKISGFMGSDNEVYEATDEVVTAGCAIRNGQPIHIEKTLEGFCIRCVALLVGGKCGVSFEKIDDCSLLGLEGIVVKASRLLEEQKKVA